MYATVAFFLTLPLLGHDSWEVREQASVTVREFVGRSERWWLKVRELAHGEVITDPEVRYRLRGAYMGHTKKIVDTLLPADAVLWPDIDRLMGAPPSMNDDPEGHDAYVQELADLRQRYVLRTNNPDFVGLYPDYRRGMRDWAIDQLGNVASTEDLAELRCRIAAAVQRDKRRDAFNAEPKDTKEYRARIAEINKTYPGIVNPRYLP